jgi:hypothetical protein
MDQNSEIKSFGNALFSLPALFHIFALSISVPVGNPPLPGPLLPQREEREIVWAFIPRAAVALLPLPWANILLPLRGAGLEKLIFLVKTGTFLD